MTTFRERLSYSRSLLVTAPLIFIYTAAFGTLSVFCSLFDAKGNLQHGCSRLWARSILRTCGVRLSVSGVDRVVPTSTSVLCVNHQSHMDIPILLSAIPFQFRFAAKKELFRYPFLGWHLRRSGHVAIDRENPRAALRALRAAAERLGKGGSLLIFPEGRTSVTGELLPFKGGGFLLAKTLDADVVPVTIRGSRAVLRPGTYHVRRGRVSVAVGKPIPSRGFTASDLAARVREEIAGAFAE